MDKPNGAATVLAKSDGSTTTLPKHGGIAIVAVRKERVTSHCDPQIVSVMQEIIDRVIRDNDARALVAQRVISRIDESPAVLEDSASPWEHLAAMTAEEMLSYLSASLDSSWADAILSATGGKPTTLPRTGRLKYCASAPADARSVVVKMSLAVDEELRRAVAKLTPEQRRVLRAVVADGQTFEEAAKALGQASGEVADLYVTASFAIRRNLNRTPSTH